MNSTLRPCANANGKSRSQNVYDGVFSLASERGGCVKEPRMTVLVGLSRDPSGTPRLSVGTITLLPSLCGTLELGEDKWTRQPF